MYFFFNLQTYYATAIYEGWRDLMDNKSDPRVKDWFLMSSPFPTIAISLTYAYFVKVSHQICKDILQLNCHEIKGRA